MERLHGPLRIAVRQTPDGLGIYIPPPRQALPLLFMSVGLAGCGYAAYHSSTMLAGAGVVGLPIWLVTWLFIGAFILRILAWQLYGEERLFFTAGTLVREWSMPGLGRRRVLAGADIRTVTTDRKARNDPAGLGTVKLTTTGSSIWVGSGLSPHEAGFVAELIRVAAGQGRRDEEPSGGMAPSA